MGQYSADSFISQASAAAADLKKKEQQLKQPKEQYAPPEIKSQAAPLPTISTPFQPTPLDGLSDWDYKNALTDPKGQPLETRYFGDIKLEPKQFDPNGNPYFGAGISGWLKKWAYKFVDDVATNQEADDAWAQVSTALEATKGTVSPFDTSEEATEARRQQNLAGIQTVAAFFDATRKSFESNEKLSPLTPVLRSVNTLVGMTLEAFTGAAELVEKSAGAQRAQREYATSAGSILPDLSIDDDEGDIRVGGYNDAANFATRIFNPLLQGYDAARFWTAPGTMEEKTEALKAGWSEGAMLYTEMVKPAVRDEYLARVKAGEDPDLLAMELQDPWIEAIGEMILDPLNVIGGFGKAKKAASTAAEAAQTVKRTGLLADPALADKMSKISSATDGQAAVLLDGITDDVMKASSTAGLQLQAAQSWKLTDLTPLGNKFKYRRLTANYLNNAVQAIKNTGGSNDDVMDYVLALTKMASGDKAEVQKALAVIAHSPLKALSFNESALQTGHMLRNIMNDDTFIKAIKETGGDWGKLTQLLDKKIDKAVDYAFPSIKEMSAAADKVKELGDAVDPATKRIADAFKALQKEHPGVVGWQKTQDALSTVMGPLNGFLANNYFSLSYGYATRNFIQNMFTLWIDGGIDFAQGFGKTERLDNFLMNALGDVPMSLRGKTQVESMTESSLAGKFFGWLNQKKYSPAALANAAEVYAGKMIYVKQYKKTMDSTLKLGAALPDAATWNKAGFSTEQANDFINIIKANDYNTKMAVDAFNAKYGSGVVDKWRQLDWVDPSAQKGLEDYQDYWNQIVNTVNTGTYDEALKVIDDLKIQVKQRANGAANMPVQMSTSDPFWREIADASKEAGRYADPSDDNKILALKIAFDRATATFNDELKAVATNLYKAGDQNAFPLADDIMEFTSEARRQQANEKVSTMVSEKLRWARDLSKQKNPVWDVSVLGPAPSFVTSEIVKDAVWKNYRETRQSVWAKYFEDFEKEAFALAGETGQVEAFTKAQKAMLELNQYRDYVYTPKGIKLQPPKLNPSTVGEAANGSNVASLAKAYGEVAPYASKKGTTPDKWLLDVINKYGEGGEFTKLDDVPLNVAERAFAKHSGNEVQGYVKKVSSSKKTLKSTIDESGLLERLSDPNRQNSFSGDYDELWRAGEDFVESPESKKMWEAFRKELQGEISKDSDEYKLALERYKNWEVVTKEFPQLSTTKTFRTENPVDELVDAFEPVPNKEGLPVPPPHDDKVSPVARVHIENKQGLLDALSSVRKGIQERNGLKVPVGGDANALKNITATLEERLAVARAQSQIVADKARDFALLPYGQTTNMDFAMSLVYPYQFWYSRSYSNWMKRAFMTNPEIISRYANMKEALATQQKDLPDWWKSQIDITKPLEWAGIQTDHPVYLNLEATVWPLYGLTGVDFNDPTKRTNWFTSMLDDMGKFGPTMYAPIQWSVAAVYYAQGEKDIAAKWAGRAIPITQTFKSLSSYVGNPIELDPAVQMFSGEGLLDFGASDPYEEGRVSRALSAMEKEGVPEWELIEAARTQSGPLWEEARRRAVQDRAGGQLASYFGGVGFKGRTESDIEIDRFYGDYFRLQNLNEAKYLTPEQYQQSFNELRERYPFMDTLLLSRRSGDSREAAYAYNVIGRLPPGKSTSDIYKLAGLDPETVQTFYDSGGKFGDMSETEKMRFMAAMVDIGTTFQIPTNATREEWTAVRTLYKNTVNAQMQEAFGEDILDRIDMYYSIEDEKLARLFMDANPEVGAAMDMRKQIIATNPNLNKYYGGIETIEQYYTNLMYDELENKYGKEIFDLETAYYEILEPKEKKQFKKQYPELVAYLDDKKKMKEANFQQLVRFGEMLPSRPEVIGNTPQNPTQEALTDFAQPAPAMTFQEWEQVLGAPMSSLIQDYFYNNEPLPYVVDQQLERLSRKYGYDSGDDLLREVLVSIR